jgi:hypothetical protein
MQRDLSQRFRNVELPVIGEFAIALVVICMVALVVLQNFAPRVAISMWFVLVVAAFAAILLRSASRRRSVRRTAWDRLVNWQEQPLRCEGPLVIQETGSGERLAAIDTQKHYTVRWERFSASDALYLVTQGANTIFVSTRAPNAAELLKGALHVANYPCEEWPDLDL